MEYEKAKILPSNPRHRDDEGIQSGEVPEPRHANFVETSVEETDRGCTIFVRIARPTIQAPFTVETRLHAPASRNPSNGWRNCTVTIAADALFMSAGNALAFGIARGKAAIDEQLGSPGRLLV